KWQRNGSEKALRGFLGGLENLGAGDGARTHNLLITSHVVHLHFVCTTCTKAALCLVITCSASAFMYIANSYLSEVWQRFGSDLAAISSTCWITVRFKPGNTWL